MAGQVLVLIVGLAAGMLSGIIGTGASIILLPILVLQFGPQQAVPIMAIAGLLGNISKAWSWWRDVDWRAFAAYSVTGIPAAALGAHTLLVLPPNVVEITLGIFFLAMIPTRRWMRAHNFHIRLWQLSIAGAVIGFLSGIVLSTGPLSVPAFTAYGLMRGAFISTEAVSSLALMASKVATFQQLGALPGPMIVHGLIVGASVMAGTFAGKLVMLRINLHTFQYLLDGMLLCSGVALLWTAFA